MSLAPGIRLGVYEITGTLGAGGMGEVFRARDTTLDRDVALKILPVAFAGDHDRLMRFEREAKTLATLNHPNVAQIYGLQQADASSALVMELVEGPTLADRIAQGALPLEETLAIARQLAEALEYAHERGIVHRDLKPANLKLTPEGQLKVLDFGLAKAVAGDPTTSNIAATHSPTLSLGATQAGVILGTAAYMSPEQAKGKPVDRRADIWAFGIVLFEMLAGRMAYEGETVAETMAHVMMKEPDWAALPAQTPVRLRELLKRCLVKDPRSRLRDIGDARLEIEHLIAQPETEATAPAVATVSAPPRARWLSTLPWAVAAIAAVTAIALGIVLWRASRPQPPAPTSRLAVTSGLEGTILDTLGPNALLSPDGSAILFRASNVAPAQLFYRRLDQLRATAITPPENTRDPFFSPDGQWVGYFAAGKLKKVAVSGGASVTLADASGSRGGTWTADGHIIFAPSANSPLMRIAEAGGTPQAITKLEGGEYGHRFPQVLGTGDTLLYTVTQSGGSAEGSTIVLQKLGSDERAVLHRGGYYGRYLTSGHLLLMQGTTLFAARMDLAERRLTTQPVPVIEKVEANPIVGGAQFAVSDTGTLVYLPPGVGGSAIIEWVDPNGNTTPLRKTPGDYYAPRISPDGRRLAVENREGQNDIWIYDWEADRTSRFTFDDVLETYPVWTPDGKRIVFARREQTRGGLFWQRADGTGDSQPLTAIGKDAQPGTNFWSARPLSFHPSGKFLLFEDTADGQRSNIMILPIEGDDASGWKPGKPYSFVSTPFAETEAHFSPDGKWIAYQSDESGTYEIYVRPFGGGEGRWQISNGGGVCPTWSPTSNELFYRATPADRQHLYVASYTATAAVFQAEKPRPLSNVTMVDRGPNRNYDLHPDGKRFAVLRALGADTGSARSQFIMVLNFFDELRRLAP